MLSIARKADASSAFIINKTTSKNRRRGPSKEPIPSNRTAKPKQAVGKSYADIEDEEDEEDEEEALLLQPQSTAGSELDVEGDMTGSTVERAIYQPPSSIPGKPTSKRSPIQPHQMIVSIRKRTPETIRDSQRPMQKRMADIYDVPLSSKDKADAQSSRQLKPSMRANKRVKTIGTPKLLTVTTSVKRPRGRPPKSIEPAALAPNKPQEETERPEDSDEDLINPADIGKAERGDGNEDEEENALNHPTSAQPMEEDDAEDDDQHNEEDCGDLTGYQMSPARPKPVYSREQHQASARNAVNVSRNHANGTHNFRNHQSPLRSGRAEEVRELGEEAADVPEESEGEEDNFQWLPAWRGIIDIEFFPKMKRISKGFGCRMNHGKWETVALETRGLKSTLGKEMNQLLKKLVNHYDDLKDVDAKDTSNQAQIFSRIKRAIKGLVKIVDELSKPLDENRPERIQQRRSFVIDLYIILIRKLLKVLKIAVLVHAKAANKGAVFDEDLSLVIKMINVILKLSENLSEKRDVVQLDSKDYGQTRKPLGQLRPLLRQFSESCEKELSLRIRAEKEEELEEEERKRYHYNKGIDKAAFEGNSGTGNLCNALWKEIEDRKRPQEERIQEELEKWNANIIPRRRSIREESSVSSRIPNSRQRLIQGAPANDLRRSKDTIGELFY